MKFWSEMSRLSSFVKQDDKIMIGENSTGLTRYIEVSSLPFVQKSDLWSSKLNGQPLNVLLLDHINPKTHLLLGTYAEYKDGLWAVKNGDISIPYEGVSLTVMLRSTGKVHVLQPNGLDMPIETIDADILASMNVGSISGDKVTSFISVNAIDRLPATDNEATLTFNFEASRWTYRTRRAGNNKSVELADVNNNFILYSQDENKFYRCSPTSPTREELSVGEGNSLGNIIFLGKTQIYSYAWSEFTPMASSTRTYDGFISSEIQKINIGDTVGIPMRISDFNEKVGYIIVAVQSVDTSACSLVGKGLAYMVSETNQTGGGTGDAPTIMVDSTVTGNAGTMAIVENVGTTNNIRLKFTIPRGATGATGARGANGTNGINMGGVSGATYVASNPEEFMNIVKSCCSIHTLDYLNSASLDYITFMSSEEFTKHAYVYFNSTGIYDYLGGQSVETNLITYFVDILGANSDLRNFVCSSAIAHLTFRPHHNQGNILYIDIDLQIPFNDSFNQAPSRFQFTLTMNSSTEIVSIHSSFITVEPYQ